MSANFNYLLSTNFRWFVYPNIESIIIGNVNIIYNKNTIAPIINKIIATSAAQLFLVNKAIKEKSVPIANIIIWGVNNAAAIPTPKASAESFAELIADDT